MTEQRKKILYVLTKDDVGGAQKYVRDLASHIDPLRSESKIIYGGTDIPSLSNRLEWWALFLNDWMALFALVRLYRREKPDVIHLNSSKAGILGSFAAGIYKILIRLHPIPYTQNPKVVFTAHGWVFNPTNTLSPLTRWFYIFLHWCAVLFQDTIICVSEYDRRLAEKLHITGSHKLVMIHNGIDYRNLAFLDKVSARKEILQRLEIRNSKLEINHSWIGSIGRLTKEKDYGTLIAAAELVPEAYFFIIGDGSEKTYLKYQISKIKINDRFFIVQPTGEDAKYLKAFDVFVLSSIKEGLPYTLLEAMVSGVPVVATDAGGMREVLRHSPVAPVSPRNPEAMASAIEKLLRDPKLFAQTSATLRHTAEGDYRLKDMVHATADCYDALLSES